MTNNYSESVGVEQLGLPDNIPNNYLDLWTEAVQPFFDELDKNFTNGLINLKRYDKYTTYGYFKEVFLPQKLPTKAAYYDEIISALEVQLVGTGMQRFPNAFLPMIKKENINLTYNSEVYKLEKTKNNKIEVHWINDGKKASEVFDRVIVTVPLGIVRHWDLPLSLSYGKRSAIRELDYGFSAKIFLQFKSRFWEKSPNETGANPTTSNVGIVGGITYTDLPIRVLVYPSFYQGIPADDPGVLLASYTWSNDAIKYGQYSDEEMYELALKDLATIHGDIVYKEWVSGKENNIAKYWSNDRTAGGPFAEYGPSQLESLMGAMMRPEESIHWGGEHTDIHCAWIVGSLNSGVRVVKEILLQNLMGDKWSELKDMTLLKYWNGNLDAFEGY
ncbi:11731_t:CDS:2 [Scutellospora calospora]|uniref:11731_t:CDS:1 n=1 Tax=Scutellospora calospora TaxID=85575 RepID=A0ACA9MVK6_9GLOM|nr:11731_t:CDS:2 [Scutellospora calospora]